MSNVKATSLSDKAIEQINQEGIDAGTLEGNDSAHHLDRANHTGTQTLDTISDAGTAAAVDTGPALNQVATGQVLADGLDAVNFGANAGANPRYVATRSLPGVGGTNDDSYLLLGRIASVNWTLSLNVDGYMAASRDVSFHVRARRLGGQDRTQGVLFGQGNGPDNVSLVTLTYEGGSYLAVARETSVSNFSRWVFDGRVSGASADVPLIVVGEGDVSDVTPFTPQQETLFFGRPGDSIGDNGSYHNPNESLGHSTPLVLGTGPTEVPTNNDLNADDWDTAFGWGNHASAGYAGLSGAQTFSGAQRASITTLTSSSSITPDFSANNHFNLVLAHNATLENPTNVVAGQSGSIRVEQDGTGGRTLAFGSSWVTAGGTAPDLSEDAGDIDRIDYFVYSSTEIHYALAKGIA